VPSVEAVSANLLASLDRLARAAAARLATAPIRLADLYRDRIALRAGPRTHSISSERRRRWRGFYR